MTPKMKPLGLPTSRVREPWNYHNECGNYSLRAEKKAMRHRKRTARQEAKRETKRQREER